MFQNQKNALAPVAQIQRNAQRHNTRGTFQWTCQTKVFLSILQFCISEVKDDLDTQGTQAQFVGENELSDPWSVTEKNKGTYIIA